MRYCCFMFHNGKSRLNMLGIHVDKFTKLTNLVSGNLCDVLCFMCRL